MSNCAMLPLLIIHSPSSTLITTEFTVYIPSFGATSVAQTVKNLPAVWETQETWAPSLGREDPLEKEVAIHSSILAWRIPWTEEPGGIQSMESHRIRHD